MIKSLSYIEVTPKGLKITRISIINSSGRTNLNYAYHNYTILRKQAHIHSFHDPIKQILFLI